jgi:hypothetical protein
MVQGANPPAGEDIIHINYQNYFLNEFKSIGLVNNEMEKRNYLMYFG